MQVQDTKTATGDLATLPGHINTTDDPTTYPDTSSGGVQSKAMNTKQVSPRYKAIEKVAEIERD